MKRNVKSLPVLIAFVAISAIATAQDIKKVPFFQLGVKGGANITKIDGQSFDSEFKFGYHLGAFAILKLSDAIQLQPEVLFNQFNTKTSDDFDDVTDADNLKDVKLNYLTIPLLLNITPAKLLSIQLGAQYGILLNKSKDFFENSNDAFKSGDFSALGGLQLNIANFKIGARYIIGLSDIGDLPNKESWKNQGFQVSVGLRLL